MQALEGLSLLIKLLELVFLVSFESEWIGEEDWALDIVFDERSESGFGFRYHGVLALEKLERPIKIIHRYVCFFYRDSRKVD